MNTINQSSNYDKILSLRLEANQCQLTMKLATSDTFKNVKSLTIFNFQDKKQICEMRIYFPILNHLSLRYDGEIDFHKILKIFELISSSIKRLEIYCDSISCSHYRLEHLFTRANDLNRTVESFVLYLNYVSRSLVNNCIQTHQKCVLRTIADFIKIMPNIRYVRIITNRSSIEPLLDATEWGNGLLDMCQELNKITLKATKTESTGKQLDSEKIRKIEIELHKKRPSMKFKVQMT
jgi:hypothetical protein